MRLIYWQSTEQIRRQRLFKTEDKLKNNTEKIRMTNTQTNIAQTTTEELAMRTMIAELKIMNLKLDMLENEIDQKLDK